MDEEDLVVLALAVVTHDLSIAKKMLHFSEDGILEEGDMMEKLRLAPTELRQLLYKMQDANLAVQLGTKEDEEGNRLTYWRINKDLARSFLLRKLREARDYLLKRMEEEELGEYYVCAADPSHIRLSFDEVISKMGESGLVCPICGAMLEPVDRERVVTELKEMLEVLNKALRSLEGGVS